jgi:hypothetical protein
VIGQLHTPVTLHSGKEPPVPIAKEAGWTPEPVWTTWRRENSWLHRDSNSDPLLVQPLARRYTDCSILVPIQQGQANIIRARRNTTWISYDMLELHQVALSEFHFVPPFSFAPTTAGWRFDISLSLRLTNVYVCCIYIHQPWNCKAPVLTRSTKIRHHSCINLDSNWWLIYRFPEILQP